MLDEKDIQTLSGLFKQQRQEIRDETAQLLTQQRQEIRDETAQLLTQQRQEIHDETAQLLTQQRQEIHDELMTVIESEVMPKLRLLAENQVSMMEKLIPVTRMEKAEEDIAVLKMAVQHLQTELNELKKAV